MALLQSNFSTVCYVSVLMMLQSQHAICIHICTWPNVKGVYQIFRSGCTHVLALSLTLTMCGFYQYYIYFKFKIVLYFLVWNICEGRPLNKLNTYFICRTYLYILLILSCVFRGCSLWWGKVVIPVDTQRVHHFSTAGLGGMMNQVYNCNLVLPV